MGSRRNNKIQIIILLVLVCLVGTMSIAYAILSTTLNINGTAQVQDASWNVHFDNVQVNPGSVEINPVITDNNKVSFSADLTTPGEFYKFSVDIVNEGSIDAMIESLIKTPELTTEQKKYLRYEVEYVDGSLINDSQLLKSDETKTISVLFSYRNDIPVSDLPNTDTDFDLELVLVYVQADSAGVEIPIDENFVRVVDGDINTIGSEICIGRECFYLIKNTGDSVVLFSKYNLYVGGDYDAKTLVFTAYGDEATGLQDTRMLGYDPNFANYNIGVTVFSNESQQGADYASYNGSIVEGYVNNYKNYFENSGIMINSARLITIEELKELGCSTAEYTCINAYDWIYTSTYWSTRVEPLEQNIWFVFYNAHLGGSFYQNHKYFGVRPVIEISASYF